MNLLCHTESSGYPPAYLQARIRGRRAWLISDWEQLLAAADPLEALPPSPYRSAITRSSAEDGWKNLLRETGWLYRQMDARLRQVFAPIFGLVELRTLIHCLRNLPEASAGKVEELLQQSLLSADLQKCLRGGGERTDVITVMAVLLAGDNRQQRRLTAVYRQEGFAGLERELTDLYLAKTAAGRLHPLIREFLARLIDARNILTLYKQLHWQISTPPAFIAGGRYEVASLSKLARSAGMTELLLLVRKLTGKEAGLISPGSLERLLLTWLTHNVRRWGRNPSGPGMILDYLWRCYLEARNLGLLIYCRGVGRELLREELIQ